jgi:HPt (histidine-containing phosphotransfer) domain-containing protein
LTFPARSTRSNSPDSPTTAAKSSSLQSLFTTADSNIAAINARPQTVAKWNAAVKSSIRRVSRCGEKRKPGAVLLWQEFQPTMTALNMDNVLESLGGDPDLLRDVLGILMDELPRHMASLRQAIAGGNAEAVEHLAHSIKGELGYLSLAEVSRNAAELEASGREANLAVSASLYGRLEAGVSEVLPQCAEWLAAYANTPHA